MGIGGGTLEGLVCDSRFMYIVYTGSLYVVEVNRLHPAGTHTVNIRGEGSTIDEAIQSLQDKLDSLKGSVL